MIFAKNETEYNNLKDTMIKKSKGLGYDEIINWQIEGAKKFFELRKQNTVKQ